MSDQDAAIATLEDSNSAIHFDSLLVLPEQFYEHRFLTGQRGEYRLLMAVLQEALRTYLTNRGSTSGKRCYEYWEVRRWFESRQTNFLFDFQTICELFSIDADALRRKLGIGPVQCYQGGSRITSQYAKVSSAVRGPRPREVPAKKPRSGLVSCAG
ncbi:MAG TPA: hypothetical protein VKV28_17650 [Candidatus Binataceae bacterium]|nr:hypothetical protein [Candidatus Binataceae bacterium]